MDNELKNDFPPVDANETDAQQEEKTGSYLQRKKIIIIVICFVLFVCGIFLIVNLNLKSAADKNKTQGKKQTEQIRALDLKELHLTATEPVITSVDSQPQMIAEPDRWEYHIAPTQPPRQPITRVNSYETTYNPQTTSLQQKMAEEKAARDSGGRVSVNSKAKGSDYSNYSLPQSDQAYQDTTRTAGTTNPDTKQAFYDQGKNTNATFGVLPAYDLSLTLQPGTVIDAVLLTAINSDLPGNIVAIVTANVFDSQNQQNLLIPQGTKLIARYNSSVAYGANRVQIAWSELYRPDGVLVNLGNMPGIDNAGATGYKGKVNNHNWELMKGMGVLAAFSLLDFELAYNAAALNSPGAVNFASDMQDIASTVGEGYVGKALDIQPTIMVKSGCEIKVFVDIPIILPPFKWGV